MHLAVYVLEGRDPARRAACSFGHDGANLVGEIAFAARGALLDWQLDLLMGLSEIAPDQVSAEALRPLIARGLIAATAGRPDLARGRRRRAGSSGSPFPPSRCASSRSACISRPARRRSRRSTRRRCAPTAWSSSRRRVGEPVDVVLVDSTSVGEVPLMSRLRARFPGALFVSLGLPQSPDFFDDIVETPNDMSRLRTSILGRLAS